VKDAGRLAWHRSLPPPRFGTAPQECSPAPAGALRREATSMAAPSGPEPYPSGREQANAVQAQAGDRADGVLDSDAVYEFSMHLSLPRLPSTTGRKPAKGPRSPVHPARRPAGASVDGSHLAMHDALFIAG